MPGSTKCKHFSTHFFLDSIGSQFLGRNGSEKRKKIECQQANVPQINNAQQHFTEEKDTSTKEIGTGTKKNESNQKPREK